MKGLLSALKQRLQRGWFGDNFVAMSTLAREAAWASQSPATLLLLSEILWTLAYQRNQEADGDQAFVPGHAARLMEQDIRPALEAYFGDGESRRLSLEAERRHLDNIVLALFKWRSRDDLSIDRPPWSPRGI